MNTKKLIFLFALFTLFTSFSTNVFCQKLGNFEMHSIYSTSLDSIENKADSIAASIDQGYGFIDREKEKSFWGDDEYSRKYRSSEGRILKIFISSELVGENTALERPGTKCYYISMLLGKYKDLFKIYKKIDPKADLIKISEHKQLSFVGLSSLFDRYSRDMIKFDPSMSTMGGHKDIWSIMFLINDFIEHKTDLN